MFSGDLWRFPARSGGGEGVASSCHLLVSLLHSWLATVWPWETKTHPSWCVGPIGCLVRLVAVLAIPWLGGGVVALVTSRG